MEQIPPSDDAATTNPHRFEASQGPRILGPNDGKALDFGSFGVRFMVWSEESRGGFSLVEHPIPPRTLAAPLHRHTNEDEYSYVLEGRMGAHSSAMRSCTRRRGISSSNPATSGIPFGTPATGRAGSLRSSPLEGSSTCSGKWARIRRQWLVRRPRR